LKKAVYHNPRWQGSGHAIRRAFQGAFAAGARLFAFDAFAIFDNDFT
jgi:hypothetical protein